MTNTTYVFMNRTSKVALCLAALSSSIVYGVLAPLLPDEAKHHGVGEQSTGMIFSAFAATVFLVSPVIGDKLIPYMGRKPSLLLGLLGLGCTTVLFAFVKQIAPESPLLFFSVCVFIRVLQGLTAALSEVASFAITASLCSGSELTGTLGLIEIFVGIGYMLGPVAGGLLFEIGGFEFPFIVLGCLQVPMCLSLNYLFPNANENDENEESHTESSGTLVRRPTVLLMLCVAVYGNASYSFLEPTLQHHVSKLIPTAGQLGGLFFLCSFAYAIFTPLFTLLSRDRHITVTQRHESISPLPRLCASTVVPSQTRVLAIGGRNVIIVGLVFISIGYSLMGPAWILHNLPGLATASVMSVSVSMIFIGIGQSASMLPLMDVILKDTGDATSDAVSGLINSAYALGEMLGPIVGTNLDALCGFETACLTWAIVGVLGIGGFLFIGLERSSVLEKHAAYGTFKAYKLED